MDSLERGRYLAETVTRLAEARTIEHVPVIVQVAARRLADADGATFVLRDGELCHYLDEEAIAPLWKGRRFDISSCVSGWTMEYRQQAIIPDIGSDERIPRDLYRPTFVRSLVMTPVQGLRPMAAIGVYWREPHTCPPEQAGWLQALADSTAVVLDRIALEAEVEELRAKLNPVKRETVMMCAWTNRLKHEGEWLGVDAYLLRRFGIVVSHGISEEAQTAIEESLLRNGNGNGSSGG